MSHPGTGTRLAGVIGHPIGHSLSPAIHNAALRHDGVDAVYLAFDLDASDLEAGVQGLRAVGGAGINVTVPHKVAVVACADSCAPEVEAVGAANLLLFRDDGVRAENTDITGFSRALSELAGDVAGRRCLLLGAGGAGRAAAWSLSRAGARLVVVNRTFERAESVAESNRGAAAASWDAIEAEVGVADVIVNATSVGLGNGSESPLTDHALRLAADGGCRAVLDLVYGRAETALVTRSRSFGIPAADGLDMLVYQAADAYELLWNRSAPVEVMADAARRATGRRDPRDARRRPSHIV